mmetsp:Transcript_55674/g.143449  ORF Transcript_55674/g.143449 Transcript_55674/m.143449 type:complete len:314 (+) Transcript_55674:502-1443(+)
MPGLTGQRDVLRRALDLTALECRRCCCSGRGTCGRCTRSDSGRGRGVRKDSGRGCSDRGTRSDRSDSGRGRGRGRHRHRGRGRLCGGPGLRDGDRLQAPPVGVDEAGLVTLPGLKRVEGHVRGVAAVFPPGRRVAVILHEQLVVRKSLSPKHAVQALVDIQVLAPCARPVALLLEVLGAAVHARAQRLDRLAGEDLDGAMETELAVDHVHAQRPLLVFAHHAAQAPGDEDRVGVDLDRPVVSEEDSVLDNLTPDGHEDVRVHRCPVDAAEWALEGNVHQGRAQRRRQLHDLVGVDGVAIAAEDASLYAMLLDQ